MSDASQPKPAQEPPAPPPNKYAWILYFAFLIVASVGVTIFMIMFNLWIQLTPEQVEAAKKVWKEKGPAEYKLIYTTRIDDSDKTTMYAVTVKAGKVTDVKKNGKDFEEQAAWPEHSMEALLGMMAANLAEDAKPDKPRVYTIGRFDDKTGALLYYVRRVMGSRERIEIEVHPSWLEAK
jgi:hypothetical protein